MTTLTSALNFGALITLSCCNAVLQIAAVPSCSDWAAWDGADATQLSPTVNQGSPDRPHATGAERSRCERSKHWGARPMQAGDAARSGI